MQVGILQDNETCKTTCYNWLVSTAHLHTRAAELKTAYANRPLHLHKSHWNPGRRRLQPEAEKLLSRNIIAVHSRQTSETTLVSSGAQDHRALDIRSGGLKGNGLFSSSKTLVCNAAQHTAPHLAHRFWLLLCPHSFSRTPMLKTQQGQQGLEEHFVRECALQRTTQLCLSLVVVVVRHCILDCILVDS